MRYVRQTTNGWEQADSPAGPWVPQPDPPNESGQREIDLLRAALDRQTQVAHMSHRENNALRDEVLKLRTGQVLYPAPVRDEVLVCVAATIFAALAPGLYATASDKIHGEARRWAVEQARKLAAEVERTRGKTE